MISWHGSNEPAVSDQGRCVRYLPAVSGHSRHATVGRWVPPVRVAGWARLSPWAGSRTSLGSGFDGLHVHCGYVGNGRNYVASLVRSDGHAKVAVEFGWAGYSTLAWQNAGPELVMDRVYLFQVDWLEDRIVTSVSSEAGVWEMTGDIPADRRLPMGAVGLRLDNLACVAAFEVRALEAS